VSAPAGDGMIRRHRRPKPVPSAVRVEAGLW